MSFHDRICPTCGAHFDADFGQRYCSTRCERAIEPTPPTKPAQLNANYSSLDLNLIINMIGRSLSLVVSQPQWAAWTDLKLSCRLDDDIDSVLGLPVRVDDLVPPDEMRLVDADGRVLGRIVGLALPVSSTEEADPIRRATLASVREAMEEFQRDIDALSGAAPATFAKIENLDKPVESSLVGLPYHQNLTSGSFLGINRSIPPSSSWKYETLNWRQTVPEFGLDAAKTEAKPSEPAEESSGDFFRRVMGT